MNKIQNAAGAAFILALISFASIFFMPEAPRAEMGFMAIAIGSMLLMSVSFGVLVFSWLKRRKPDVSDKFHGEAAIFAMGFLYFCAISAAPPLEAYLRSDGMRTSFHLSSISLAFLIGILAAISDAKKRTRIMTFAAAAGMLAMGFMMFYFNATKP